MGRKEKLIYGIVVVMMLIGMIGMLVKVCISKEEVPIWSIFQSQDARTIRVVGDESFSPYSFNNNKGQMEGADIELLREIGERLGVNIELDLMEWADAIECIQSGRADILLGVDYRPNVLDHVLLSIPVHNDPFMAFSKVEVSQISDLYDLRIGVLEKSNSVQSVIIPHQLDKNITTYPTYAEVFNALEQGEIDVCIASYTVGLRSMELLEETDIQPTGSYLASSGLCLGIYEQEIALYHEVNKVIIELYQDGTIDRINDKWVEQYIDSMSLKEYLRVHALEVAIGALFILVMLAAGIIVLYKYRLNVMEKQHVLQKNLYEYQKFMMDVTKGLFDGVYNMDITHNKPLNKETSDLWMKMSLPKNASYDEALRGVAAHYIHPDSQALFCQSYSLKNIVSLYKKGMTQFTIDYQVIHDSNKVKWYSCSVKIIYWDESSAYHLIVYMKDITKQKVREELLLTRCREDSMTKLYNKVTTEELVRKALLEPMEKGQLRTLLLLDIDEFKQINDTYGHGNGDLVILEFSNTLRNNLRKTDIIGRVGGDEFAVFISNIEDPCYIKEVATKLVQRLDKIIITDSTSMRISASIGIAYTTSVGITYEELFEVADKALYEAKNRGRNRYFIDKEITK